MSIKTNSVPWLNSKKYTSNIVVK